VRGNMSATRSLESPQISQHGRNPCLSGSAALASPGCAARAETESLLRRFDEAIAEAQFTAATEGTRAAASSPLAHGRGPGSDSASAAPGGGPVTPEVLLDKFDRAIAHALADLPAPQPLSPAPSRPLPSGAEALSQPASPCQHGPGSQEQDHLQASSQAPQAKARRGGSAWADAQPAVRTWNVWAAGPAPEPQPGQSSMEEPARARGTEGLYGYLDTMPRYQSSPSGLDSARRAALPSQRQSELDPLQDEIQRATPGITDFFRDVAQRERRHDVKTPAPAERPAAGSTAAVQVPAAHQSGAGGKGVSAPHDASATASADLGIDSADLDLHNMESAAGAGQGGGEAEGGWGGVGGEDNLLCKRDEGAEREAPCKPLAEAMGNSSHHRMSFSKAKSLKTGKKAFRSDLDALDESLKGMRGRSAIGVVVNKGSKSWLFCYATTTGITLTATKARDEALNEQDELRQKNPRSNLSPDPSFRKTLTEAAFAFSWKEKFIERSSNSKMKFKDYASEVFRDLRVIYGVDDASYLESINRGGLSEISTEETGSKSGQKFLITSDGRYFMKTITKVEAKFFRSILPQYYRHMESCRNTVLCRFFGLHRLKHASWNKLYLIIMSNIFDTDRVIHTRYDLKGSKVGRQVSEFEKTQATTIYKDLDFLENQRSIVLGSVRRAAVLEQVPSLCGRALVSETLHKHTKTQSQMAWGTLHTTHTHTHKHTHHIHTD
jgi:hypothetical protein